MGNVKKPTQSIRPCEIEKKWVLIDAKGQHVGRLASRVAFILMGKNKPTYTPHMDCGDNVIITNGAEVIFTGRKETRKRYLSHTGYPGGQRAKTPAQLRANHPTRILEKAVRGMLPKNKRGRQLFKNMAVYKGEAHPHNAQKPVTLPS